MPEEITTQPRLYVGSEGEANMSQQQYAQISRLKSLQQSIARRPETFYKAFTELGEDATAELCGINDEEILTRQASRDPASRIKEYFQKRDDLQLELDDASDEAIYDSAVFRQLSSVSKSKMSTSIKVGSQGTEMRANPEGRKASNETRRYILGEYIARAILWKAQQDEGKVHRSAG